jgi:hypothetical protein
MPARRESSVTAVLTRIPVAALGVVIAASALQASCSGQMDDDGLTDAGRADGAAADGPGADADAAKADSPSEDSPADRADGMSYGDGYGKEDAHETDAHGVDDGSCVTSTTSYPPAPGCPPGNHTWSCWPPTSATSGIPDSYYTVLTLCGDVVVLDKNTHLMWAQDAEPDQYTWVAAAAACTSSRRAGFSDWRLPSSNELMSLVDYANSTAIFDTNLFKGSSGAAWSSTPFVQQTGNAWQLYGSGGIYPQVVSDAAYARCVR